VPSRRNPKSAQRNIVPPSRGIHDRPDRVHNDLRLIDWHNVTGLFGNDLTSAFRNRDLITLQVARRATDVVAAVLATAFDVR
jgi:hypothetical protein